MRADLMPIVGPANRRLKNTRRPTTQFTLGNEPLGLMYHVSFYISPAHPPGLTKTTIELFRYKAWHWYANTWARVQKANFIANAPTRGFTDVLVITPNVDDEKLVSGLLNCGWLSAL